MTETAPEPGAVVEPGKGSEGEPPREFTSFNEENRRLSAIEHEPSPLIVDARELRFADSSAIALWVQWAIEVPEIELRDPSPLSRRVVETMGLADMFKVTP